MGIFEVIAACVALIVLAIASNTVLPWIGHIVMKVLTFGKVDFGWRSSDEGSCLTMWIDIGVVLLMGGAIAEILHR